MDSIKPIEPTWRDSAADALAQIFGRIGFDRYKALRHARTVTGGPGGGLGGFGLLDITPAGLAFGAQEGGLLAGMGAAKAQRGGLLDGLADMAVGSLALAPVAAPVAGSVAAKTLAKSSGYASKSAKIRPPPIDPQRPFSHDYQTLAVEGSHGQPLLADIEGRPLGKGVVVGRRNVGGPDYRATDADIRAVLGALGLDPMAVRASDLPRDSVGAFRRQGGGGLEVAFDQRLTEAQLPGVLAHELGHAIDHFAGPAKSVNSKGFFSIPTDGIKTRMPSIFDDLNSPQGPSRLGAPRTPKQQVTPEGPLFRYTTEDAPGERMAEAIRWYATDPNSFKTRFPEVAARIREYVNANPLLKDVIQFNSMAGAGLLGAGMLNQRDEGL